MIPSATPSTLAKVMAEGAAMATTTGTPSLGKPQSQARLWFEPLLVVCMMLGSLIINRRRSRHGSRPSDLEDTTTLLQKSEFDSDDEDSISSSSSSRSNGCCSKISSLDSSRNAHHPHSRLLQKFPFAIEMFYWGLNYVTYLMTKKIAASLYSNGTNQVTALAQQHGIDILNLEHNSIFSIFFLQETAVQAFALKHSSIITVFNQIYSLVHIPGTVAFLSWYYWAAPNHDTFAIARRTMTLGNFAAFFVFSLYPCMPPRLLPESFGFKDTVRQEHAESVWATAANVNELAAMPSLHFTYAFVIGSTFLYHSGLLQLLRRNGRRTTNEPRRSVSHMVCFTLAAFLYPALVLAVIVATANHYWLDAVVATFIVCVSYLFNRVWCVLLPAEHLLCWVLRIKKPVPTTGQATADEQQFRWRKARQSLDVPSRRV